MWIKKNKLINEVQTSVNEILNDISTFNAKNGSFLILSDFSVGDKPDFVNYLRSGWSVSVFGAIDFTASNGDPRNPNSLHFRGAKSQYEQAITNVGEIIQQYDTDKRFPFYGFGAKVPDMDPERISHCFPINGKPWDPEIYTINNVVKTYKETLKTIYLAGPTYFAPVLENFMVHAKEAEAKMQYQVLLILTDGTIHDMPRTKELLVELSNLPCSVIIVGLGDDDFTSMEELDSDSQLLTDDNGNVASRDIVQFVGYSEAMQRGELAEQVLKEVPDQVCSYMELAKYVPEPQDQFYLAPQDF